MMNDMHIVIASDNYYFAYVFVAVKTLFENGANQRTIIVHYIEQNVNKQNIEALKKLEKNNRIVDIIHFNIPKQFDQVLPSYGAASKTTYAKFWFASMFPSYDRVLYLDPDVIVLKNIEKLYDLDMKDNLIAAVIENLPDYHRTASKMKKEDSYINGGMVLCNLKLWREYDFETKALKRLMDTTHNLNYDQGILNEICNGKIKILPPKYAVLAEEFAFKSAKKMKQRYGFVHFYSQKQIDEAVKNPVIVHFTGFLYGKPMSLKCSHPYSEFFRSQLNDAPFSYSFDNNDISFGQKIRKFFLEKLPFSIYLILESFLDIHRKRSL